MVEFYIDDNGTIRADSYTFATIPHSGNNKNRLGLNDIDQVTGLPDSTVSTWMIDHVTFKVQSNLVDAPPVGNNGFLTVQCGVLPTTVADKFSISGYQDVKGWPLPKGQVKLYASNEHASSNGSISWTYTYKPRSKLALNRLQEFIVGVTASQGEWRVLMSIVIQAKRGRG